MTVGYTEHITDMRRDPEETEFGMFHMRPALSHSSNRRIPWETSTREVLGARSSNHLSLLGENVGVTLVEDSHGGAAIEYKSACFLLCDDIWKGLNSPEKFTAGSSKLNLFIKITQLENQALQNPFCRKVIPSPSKIRSPRAPLTLSSILRRRGLESSTLLWATEIASEVRYTVWAVYLGVLLRNWNGEKTHVVSAEVVDGSLGEHSVVYSREISFYDSNHSDSFEGSLHSSSDLRRGGQFPAMRICKFH